MSAEQELSDILSEAGRKIKDILAKAAEDSVFPTQYFGRPLRGPRSKHACLWLEEGEVGIVADVATPFGIYRFDRKSEYNELGDRDEWHPEWPPKEEVFADYATEGERALSLIKELPKKTNK